MLGVLHQMFTSQGIFVDKVGECDMNLVYCFHSLTHGNGTWNIGLIHCIPNSFNSCTDCAIYSIAYPDCKIIETHVNVNSRWTYTKTCNMFWISLFPFNHKRVLLFNNIYFLQLRLNFNRWFPNNVQNWIDAIGFNFRKLWFLLNISLLLLFTRPDIVYSLAVCVCVCVCLCITYTRLNWEKLMNSENCLTRVRWEFHFPASKFIQ